MDIKRQILLPKSAFALATDEDTFITLELSRTFDDLKTEKIDNVFNINQQYEKERQDSLKFCIYGLVESRFINTENVIIDVKDSNNIVLNLPKISNDNISGKTFSIKTFEMTPNANGNGMSKNVYGKTKSAFSFLFEISKYDLKSEEDTIKSNGGIPKTKVLEFTVIDIERNILFVQKVPYIFYDLDGNMVKFGSQTADVDDDGNIIEIDNDFPFFYDRHWVKQYFDLTAPSNAYFPQKNITVQENSGTVKLKVALDQKSKYGLEQVSVVLDVDSTIRNPNQDFTFTSQTVRFEIGEDLKEVDLNIFNDKFVENDEDVSFKLSDFKFCIPRSTEDTKMTVKIDDEDIPSEIRFLTTSNSLKSNASAYTLTYVFDKPLEVPNQSIVLYYTPQTNAVLGTDFIFNTSSPASKEITLAFNEGAISGSTTIALIDNNVYDLDKKIQFAFKNPTQNIIISNVGATPNVGQVSELIIQDSIEPLFSSYIVVNNGSKKINPVRSGSIPTNSYDNVNGKFFNSYYWTSKDIKKGFLPSSAFKITVTNQGDPVLYGGKIYGKQTIITGITFSAQQPTDFVLQLPSNSIFNKTTRRYTKTKYNINFECKDKFLAESNPGYTNYAVVNSFNYLENSVDVDKDAGLLNSKKYYLTTKLKNFILNYDKATSACTLDENSIFYAYYQKVNFAYTNNLVFMGFNPFNSFNGGTNLPPPNASLDSGIETTFETALISTFCSQTLPFGFDRIPGPPYNFKFINVSLRDIYPQANVAIPDYFSNLKNDGSYIPNVIGINANRGFIKWKDAPTSTKEPLILSVLNNGEVPVQISGVTVAPAEKMYFRGYDYDLNKFSVTLPTNESFIKTATTFAIANYILALENISYYDSRGQLSGTPISIQFESTNNLKAGPLSATPQYNIVTEYNQMFIPYQNNDITAPVSCTSNDFSFGSRLRLTNIAFKGVLLPNSRSSFRRGYFVSTANDLTLTCVNDVGNRLPFKKIL